MCVYIKVNYLMIICRDVRRLIVAMSRARLGLYIFGRVNLFQRYIEP